MMQKMFYLSIIWLQNIHNEKYSLYEKFSHSHLSVAENKFIPSSWGEIINSLVTFQTVVSQNKITKF